MIEIGAQFIPMLVLILLSLIISYVIHMSDFHSLRRGKRFEHVSGLCSHDNDNGLVCSLKQWLSAYSFRILLLFASCVNRSVSESLELYVPFILFCFMLYVIQTDRNKSMLKMLKFVAFLFETSQFDIYQSYHIAKKLRFIQNNFVQLIVQE